MHISRDLPDETLGIRLQVLEARDLFPIRGLYDYIPDGFDRAGVSLLDLVTADTLLVVSLSKRYYAEYESSTRGQQRMVVNIEICVTTPWIV